MKIEYVNQGREYDIYTILIFTLGNITALKNKSITLTDSWNIFLNIDNYLYMKKNNYPSEICNIVNLCLDLEGVKTTIPCEFNNSCDEIIGLCQEELKKINFEENLLNHIITLK